MKHGAIGTRIGKAVAAACVGLCCALLVAEPALAGPQDNGGQGQRRGEGGRRDFRDSRWGDARDARSFEGRAEEQRRLMEENNSNAEMSRRMGRMTPDERRDLRRQINEAGQEVYSMPRRQ